MKVKYGDFRQVTLGRIQRAAKAMLKTHRRVALKLLQPVLLTEIDIQFAGVIVSNLAGPQGVTPGEFSTFPGAAA